MGIDGCECVSAWSWIAVGLLLGVVGTIAFACGSFSAQLSREEED